jgi:gluconate:H+ symporter, GntP family
MEPATTSVATVSYWPLIVFMIGLAFVVVGIAVLKIHPFFVLTMAAILVGLLSGGVPDAAQATRFAQAVELAMSELGAMAGSVAFVILLAAIIGMCMLRSGAADQIVNRAVAVLGETRAPLALLVSGFFLAIPVFFDTVFFLLLPLARAMSIRTGRFYVLYILAICAGAAVAHTLVAPTPGPLIIAEALRPIGVDLGSSIMAGIVAGIFPAAATLYFARWVDARRPVAVRYVTGDSAERTPEREGRAEEDLPPFLLSALPVIVPVTLISVASVVSVATAGDPTPGVVMGDHDIRIYIDFLGNKNIAMLIGAVIATYIFVRQKKLNMQALTEAMGPAIATGGVIVLITAAGGAFGAMIRHSGVGDVIRVMALEYRIDFVLLAWLVAAIIRVAQGSSTVAMITTASLMTAIVGDPAALASHPLYIFLATGFGSLFCSWMNDSGFWVVGKLSGLTERETLRSWTMMTIVVSVLGLIQIMIMSRVFPFT